MKKFLICILFILIAVAPVNAIGMRSTMDTLMASWIGEDINLVINQWGYPSDSKNIAGRTLYYWKKASETMYTGSSIYMYGSELTCSMIFEVDKDNVIVNGKWEGNNCPITYFEVRKYANPKNNPWEKKSIKIKSKK